MSDIIIIIVIAAIVALAGRYVWKAKKSSQKCIGCPHSKTCSSKNSGCGCSEK